MEAKPELAITHAPGCMFVTDSGHGHEWFISVNPCYFLAFS
jgi:hypothetical protein